jgi:predicted MFS family arabinose efflux permease
MWIFLYADLIQVVVSLIILGAGNVMLNASFGALQTDLTPQEERGKVSGFINFAMYIVLAAGSFTGGYLYEHVTPQAPFILAIVTFLLSSLLTLALVREPERREK